MTPSPADVADCLDPHALDLGFMQLDWLQVIVLGVVQGVTELLPISSTAHLRVIPGLLGWRDPGSAFSAAMQLASFVAVMAFFRDDIRRLSLGSIGAVLRRDWSSIPLRLVIGIILGTIPFGIAGWLLRPVLNGCNSPLRSLLVVGGASIVMALLLAVAERAARHIRGFADLRLRDCIWVGVAQAFAVIPGVSRSGATLTAGLFCSMQRETAARFSFLLGLPAITIAGFYEIYVLLRADLPVHAWYLLGVGLVTASITAFGVIYGLLHFLERRSTWTFVWYRFFMGLALMIGVLSGFLKN
ncbi:MAG: undecaprenyl-diphosphate phosphatase [Burkholderiaceae bacterium]|jgi:undecaprenyl-diphosphatase